MINYQYLVIEAAYMMIKYIHIDEMYFKNLYENHCRVQANKAGIQFTYSTNHSKLYLFNQ